MQFVDLLNAFHTIAGTFHLEAVLFQITARDITAHGVIVDNQDNALTLAAFPIDLVFMIFQLAFAVFIVQSLLLNYIDRLRLHKRYLRHL